jgi:hypothetical protein
MDLIVRDGQVITNPGNRAKSDASIKGYKKYFKVNPEAATEKADAIIKNTYRTLMTRGMKGCYVYFIDKETELFFKSRIRHADEVKAFQTTHTLKLIHSTDIINEDKYIQYLPVYSLKAAAGYFGESQSVQAEGWVKVSNIGPLDENMFVAQVTGKSMEPKISDGDYCVFRFHPVGTRQGKIVLVQYRGLEDPDTGGSFTVKKYKSEKVVRDDGMWMHSQVTLSPLNSDYQPIILKEEDEGDVQIIAEFLSVIKATE